MLNLHPLECTIKDNDHIPDLLLINYASFFCECYNKWDSGNHTTAKVWPYTEGYSTCHYGQ